MKTYRIEAVVDSDLNVLGLDRSLREMFPKWREVSVKVELTEQELADKNITKLLRRLKNNGRTRN